MKIALCIYGLTNGFGGAERSITDLANELSTRGYEVVLLTKQDEKYSKTPLYPINKKVKLEILVNKRDKFLSKLNFTSKFINCNFSDQILNLKVFMIDIKINFHFIDILINYFRFNKSKIDHPANNWINDNYYENSKWTKKIKEIKPDLIISYMVNTYIQISFSALELSIPHIVVTRTNPKKFPYFFNDIIYKDIIDFTILNAKKNIILHDSFKDYYKPEYHFKTITIPNHIENNSDKVDDKRENNFTILNVGSFLENKNQLLLILSFSLIEKNYPEWKVQLYGEFYGYQEQLKKIVDLLGLKEKVFFNKPTTEIKKVYQNATIFAFQSLLEGHSRALSEATSFGLPCVVVENCEVNAEIVKNGNFGLIAKNDVRDFADKLEYLIINDKEREKFRDNAINSIKKYKPKDIFDKWEDVIKSSINRK